MHVFSYIPYGMEGFILKIEADLRRGIPGIEISGLADSAIREARERIRVAFRNSGFPFPQERIVVNLAPAGVKKEGAALDLPIALAIMSAAGLVPPLEDLMVLGELELSGKVRPVRAVMAAVLAGMKAGLGGFLVPAENLEEAALARPRWYVGATTLEEAVHFARQWGTERCFCLSEKPAASAPSYGSEIGESSTEMRYSGHTSMGWGDFSEVRGQARYKRALEIAAAGGHHVLVYGPPGCGKTMLAFRLPSIMAPLLPEEAIEVFQLYNLAGQERQRIVKEGSIRLTPPFRSPHHSASMEGILGGGRMVRPGEISLSHYGVLFLDEAPEFARPVLKALREPLEEGVITIARSESSVQLPAQFQLLLAANPCPCGKLGIEDPTLGSLCFCSESEIQRHWQRLGSALLDRIELRVAVRPPCCGDPLQEEQSTTIQQRVMVALQRQRERFNRLGLACRRNSRIPPGALSKVTGLSFSLVERLETYVRDHHLSGRGFHAVLRLARTIADLADRSEIRAEDVEEALLYRITGEDPLDKIGE
ncbi:MAG: YifB family Mg chelatase-like AAA ATPase [Treponemataceae bacterium]|nr:YifB family Mg chelatase-like AAA ATPase [Treponemataceae bacterium]